MVSPNPITESIELVEGRISNVSDLERKLKIPELPQLLEILQNEIRAVDEEGKPVIYRGTLSKLRYHNSVDGTPF